MTQGNSKEKFYYEHLYDKLTVKECRDWINNVLNNKLPEGAKKLPKEEQLRFAAVVIEVPLYFIKGERYLKRKETIDAWIKRDEKRDEFVTKHPAPVAYCPKCNNKMDLMVSELDHYSDDDHLRMMFLYKCGCGEKSGVYSDGEPYVFKLDYCPKCHKEWDKRYTKLKDKIKTDSLCSHCGYKEKDVLDLSIKEEKDPNFEVDRAKFCMTEEEGEAYRREKATIPDILKWKEEADQREKDKIYYDKAKSIKTLTVAELADLLAKILAEKNYKGLMITSTEIKRDLIISFTIQDAKAGRSEYDSRSGLKKVIHNTLEDTNWKLMSDGISYKLGLLSGRLRGLDNEKDIVESIKNR